MPEHDQPGIHLLIVALQILLYKHHLLSLCLIKVIEEWFRVIGDEVRPARIEGVPQVAAVPRHLEPVGVVRQYVAGLVISLGYHVGQSAGHRLDRAQEEVAPLSVVVVHVVGEVAVVDDCVVLVGFFCKSLNTGTIVDLPRGSVDQ